VAGVSIMSTRYSLYIDIGNVAESDEKKPGQKAKPRNTKLRFP
jgi:hypothetical protein